LDTQLDIGKAAKRATLIVSVPAAVAVNRAGDLEFSPPWKPRRIDARILDDLRRTCDGKSAAYFARRYGKFTPPDFYPFGEPVSVYLHWAEYLPAVIVAADLFRLGRDLPRPVKSALGSPSSASRTLAETAVGALNSALWNFRLTPQLVFDAENRRWTVTIATGPRGEVDCALAACLYFALNRITGPPGEIHFAECSVCRRVFQPDRAPSPRRASYCPDCRGTPAMWRLIKQRQRARG
jgi:hypothetical protein